MNNADVDIDILIKEVMSIQNISYHCKDENSIDYIKEYNRFRIKLFTAFPDLKERIFEIHINAVSGNQVSNHIQLEVWANRVYGYLVDKKNKRKPIQGIGIRPSTIPRGIY